MNKPKILKKIISWISSIGRKREPPELYPGYNKMVLEQTLRGVKRQYWEIKDSSYKQNSRLSTLGKEIGKLKQLLATHPNDWPYITRKEAQTCLAESDNKRRTTPCQVR